ncbi:hypothetical protein QAD02_008529 [Eretmocerus hayati]|uniref:Uncharacterized protein n=1 Tax=Eretmocerus hayati TaxID=131215 RepID=A0ACC2N947_9HYME|nr:hypothetical protein QAD02_008529 [Eretmocerus hayati]
MTVEEESLSSLDSDSLRVEPLGHDRKNSAYWYFYGTRLYREDYIDSSDFVSKKQKARPKDKIRTRGRSTLATEKEEEEEEGENCEPYQSKDNERDSIWQVICFTPQDWDRLVEKFKDSECAIERKLYRTLSRDFMPEIPKLFDLKEKQQRRKLLQRARAHSIHNSDCEGEFHEITMVKSKVKSKSSKGSKKSQSSKNTKVEEDLPPPPVQKKGRQTNNSLACADGQILIDTCDEIRSNDVKKSSGKHNSTSSAGYGYGYKFGIEEEEQQVGMHKVLKILKDHEDAWPFTDPVDEQYAPRYYSVVRRPMDLTTMEDKLEEGSYKNVSQFKKDFHLIIDNCKQYNGSENEYTEMAMTLKDVFDRAVDRYLESEQSDDGSLSDDSRKETNSSPFKNKTPPSAVRHSQRHKHPRKLSKKIKPINKLSKKKSRQRVNEESEKEDSDSETKVVKIKDKKNKKKSKKCKVEVKEEEESEEREDEDDEQENEGAILNERNVIKAKRQKSGDKEQTLSKSKRLSVKEEVKKDSTRLSKKSKKQNGPDKDSRPAKEMKENRKRKDDFEEDCDLVSIPKSKSKKIEKKEKKEKKENKGLDVLIERVKKSKMKKEEPLDTSFEEDGNHVTPEKKKKNRKMVKEKKELSSKRCDKEKNKKSKRKTDECVKNGRLKKKEDEYDFNECFQSETKPPIKKIESSITKKDIESLDSLKDRISEKRREEKLKSEEKKKKHSKVDGVHGISKKVPSNGNSYHHSIDKLGHKNSKSKKLNKEEKSDESKSQNQDESEPKKIKTSSSKQTKGSAKGDPTMLALNQATEQTLNDMNKWLDDTPRLPESSSVCGGSSLQTSTSSDHTTITASRSKQQQSTANTSSANSHSTINSNVGDASRKRPSSTKLIAPLRAKKVQRTIDRLQPGKSKGNLLSKKPALLLGSSGGGETSPGASTSSSSSLAHQPGNGTGSDVLGADKAEKKEPSRSGGASGGDGAKLEGPKLSLGTVLKNVDSIQLCKSLVSSPNAASLSNDEDEDAVTGDPISTTSNSTSHDTHRRRRQQQQQRPLKQHVGSARRSALDTDASNAAGDEKPDADEAHKPKSATPNLSAWFKAFGAPKSKKKEEEEESSGTATAAAAAASSPASAASGKKEEPSPLLSNDPAGSCRQRRMSTGGSSVSESVSSFSQESPPSRTGRSPQQPQPQQSTPSSTVMLSPVMEQQQQLQMRGAGFYQDALSTGSSPYNSPYYTTPPRYSAQLPPTPSPQHHPLSPAYPSSFEPVAPGQQQGLYAQSAAFHKPSPQQQQSPQPEQAYPGSSSTQATAAQGQSPVYPQQSPQSLQSSPYPQQSPQAASYSQPSPQSQPPTPGYSQPSPQTPASNYSQPSPSQLQQHSPYSQSSPQPPPSYSQPSPGQSQQHSPYSQVSPRPPSSTYSQPSPQPPNYSAQTPSPYSQPDLVIAQPSPRGYSQTSPQQPPPSYSQSSPQTPSPYSAQPSPQHQPPTYSHPSPQTPPSYSQPSPQSSQPQPSAFSKSSDDYGKSSFVGKSGYLSQSGTPAPLAKPTATKEKPIQQQTIEQQHLTTLNQQVYHTGVPSSQYPSAYPSNVFSTADRVTNPIAGEPMASRTLGTSRLPGSETQQLGQQRQLNQEQQSQLLSFQQNLASHEPLYPGGFQASSYPMPNPACRPAVYPGYFDTSKSSANGSPSPGGGSLAPAKKRTYNEISASTDAQAQAQRASQDQYSFDSLMALAHSQPDVSVPVSNQFDNAFASSLADSNPAYARLQLGLVGRSAKETQQLLSIPRLGVKPDPLVAYARASTPGQPELNLLQSLQNVGAKNSGMLPVPRAAVAAARNYPGHPFLHSGQRPNPYGPPVAPYVSPHGTMSNMDPAAYQQYLHSLYALQPHSHRPAWL